MGLGTDVHSCVGTQPAAVSDVSFLVWNGLLKSDRARTGCLQNVVHRECIADFAVSVQC